MRNLKKVLSLTLALVMMLGMMTFAGAAETKKVASAADLTDMDKVVNKEAVSLLVDLKIVGGRDTGAFDPTGTLTRAEFAKMIYVAKMGADDKAANFVGAATGLTDTKMWAEGYINYCFSTGIVAGRTATVFDPDGKLKTVEAAKMLLVALGYDSEAQGYVKDSLWSVNVMQDAKKNGLMDGVKDAADAFLSRDSAAQMISNALFAKTITNERQKDFTGKWYISKTTQNTTTLGQEVFGLVKIGTTVTAVANGKATFTSYTVNGAGVTLTGEKITGVLVATPDTIGSNVYVYVKGSISGTVVTIDKVYSSALLANKGSVMATTNTGIASLTNAYNPAHEDFLAKIEDAPTGISKAATVTYYVNGADNLSAVPYGHGVADAAAGGTKDDEAANTTSDVDAIVAKTGVIVEFIDTNANGKADVIRIINKTVATVAADPTTKVVGDDTQVKVPGITGLNSFTNTKNVVGYEGLKKGDVVLFVNVGGVTFIEKAASVEGVVAGKKSDGKLNVGGTYYATSGLNGASNAWTANDYKNSYKFYLDNSNSIVKAEQVTEETVSNYLVVLSSSWVTGNGEIDKSQYAQAKVLHTDGTVEIVTVGKMDAKKIIAPAAGTTNAPGDGKIHFSWDADGAASGTALTYAMADNNFYTYSKDAKGVYSLTTVVNTNQTSLTIKTGTAKLDGNADEDTIANSATVFVVQSGTGDNITYTPYTGIAKVPSMNSATANTVVKDGLAAYVFVYVNTMVGTTGDMVYLTSTNYEVIPEKGNVPQHYVYEAIVNGEKTTVKMAALVDNVKSGEDEYNNEVVAKTLYEVKGMTGDKLVEKLDAVALQTGVKVSNGTMITNTKTDETQEAYVVNADTKIFYIATDGTVSALDYTAVTADQTDSVVVTDKTTDNVANVVYILQVVSSEKVLTSIDYTLNGGAKVTKVIAATGAVAPAAGSNGKLAAIVDAVVSDGATWTVDKSVTVAANSTPAGETNQISLIVIAEDGTATAAIKLDFVAGA